MPSVYEVSAVDSVMGQLCLARAALAAVLFALQREIAGTEASTTALSSHFLSLTMLHTQPHNPVYAASQ